MRAITIRRCLALMGMSFLTAFAATAPAMAATWHFETAPWSGHLETKLQAVSCAGGISCLAAGEDSLEGGALAPLSMVWEGKHWTRNYPTSPTDGSLDAISCTSSTNCVSAGSSEHKPLLETWDGFSWTSKTPSSHTGEATVLGVSCVSTPHSCTAVGTEKTPGQALPETWVTEGEGVNEWQRNTGPLPKGGTVGQENGVSCSTSKSCIAVGNWRTAVGGETKPLVERWTGLTAVAETPPAPAPPFWPNASLNGLSCTGETCIAVGTVEEIGKPGKLLLFSDYWNGKAWSEHSLPSPVGTTSSDLTGVSCHPATECMAIGYYETETHKKKPLAELWNGTAWSLAEQPPVENGALETHMQGISCPASKLCYAVGFYKNEGAGLLPVVERYE